MGDAVARKRPAKRIGLEGAGSREW